MEERIKQKHESFGMIGVSRVHGTDTPLFGSSIKHHNTIRIRIARAEVDRSLHQDWYHAREGIVEIEMSPSQFADCITNPNMGEGVPCTIRYVGGLAMATCPFTSKHEEFNQEFQSEMENVAKLMDTALYRAQALLESKTNPKTQQKDLLATLTTLKQELKDNMPFIHKQFARQMEKSVVEAKGEVEAFITGAIRKTGLEALKAQMPALLEGEKKEGEK